MVSEYRVSGKWKGSSVNQEIDAYSARQAKLKAAFKMGLTGKDISEFVNSKSIKSTRI